MSGCWQVGSNSKEQYRWCCLNGVDVHDRPGAFGVIPENNGNKFEVACGAGESRSY